MKVEIRYCKASKIRVTTSRINGKDNSLDIVTDVSELLILNIHIIPIPAKAN